MSLFQCDHCGSMENTGYSECGSGQMKLFVKKREDIAKYKRQLGLKDNEPFGNYCSACCPLGDCKWHGEFNRIYLPKGEFETAPNGNLRIKGTLEDCVNLEQFAVKIERV